MKYRDLTQADEELLAAAFAAIRRNYRADHHQVGAAVRAASGQVHAGVNMESPGVDVCAEWVALGKAVSAGERRFSCVVAVNRRGVMSPCGVCRELLHHYAPDIDVIVPDEQGRPTKVTISELLPIPYNKRPPAPNAAAPSGPGENDT